MIYFAVITRYSAQFEPVPFEPPQWFFFFGGNFCFRGNRFSEFLGEMYLGENLGLAFLGEIVLGKIFETWKLRGNELGEMLTKIFPQNHTTYKYFCKTRRDPIKISPSRRVLHPEVFFFYQQNSNCKVGEISRDLKSRGNELGELCFHMKIWGKWARGNLQKKIPLNHF